MNKCAEYMELISAYTDDELTESEKARMEKHLMSCESCSAILGFYREISAAATDSVVAAPDALRAGVMEKVLSGEIDTSAGKAGKSVIIRTILTRYLPVAACLAVVLITLPWIINNNNSNGRQNNEFFSGTGETAEMSKNTPAPAAMPVETPEQEASMDYYAPGSSDGGMYSAGGAVMPSAPPSAMPPDTTAGYGGRNDDRYMGADSAEPENTLASTPEDKPFPEESTKREPWLTNDDSLEDLQTQVESGEALPDFANAYTYAYADAYAWIEITGDLPDLLNEYEPEPVSVTYGFDALFRIPRSAAQVLMKEYGDLDGVDFRINDRNSDYAVVFYSVSTDPSS